jgi:hypothetical protein
VDVVIRFLSRTEVAERLGIKPDTLGRYKLPPPDAVIGTVRGWTSETIDGWTSHGPARAGVVRLPNFCL